jgi:hypothetical protein
VVHAASGGYRAAAAIVGDLLMTDLDAVVTGQAPGGRGVGQPAP